MQAKTWRGVYIKWNGPIDSSIKTTMTEFDQFASPCFMKIEMKINCDLTFESRDLEIKSFQFLTGHSRLNRNHSCCLLRLKPLFLNDKIQLNWNPSKSHLDFYYMKFEAAFEQMRKSTITTNIETVVNWRWCTEIAKKTEKKNMFGIYDVFTLLFFLLLKKKHIENEWKYEMKWRRDTKKWSTQVAFVCGTFAFAICYLK